MDDWYSSTRKIPNVCCCPSSMIPFFLSVLLEQRSRERNGRDGLGWTLLQEGKRKTRPTRTNLFLTSLSLAKCVAKKEEVTREKM